MANFPIPPTYAMPVEQDAITKQSVFNPIWLRWFLDVAAYFAGYAAGSSAVPSTRKINTTAPLAGGGTLGGDLTLTFTTPGADTQVLFNDGGVPGADADFTWDKSTNTLTVKNLAIPAGGKLGVFGTAPIVQVTAAVGVAARAAVGGANVQVNDTFGGYTIGQIVQALKNYGLLA